MRIKLIPSHGNADVKIKLICLINQYKTNTTCINMSTHVLFHMTQALVIIKHHNLSIYLFK